MAHSFKHTAVDSFEYLNQHFCDLLSRKLDLKECHMTRVWQASQLFFCTISFIIAKMTQQHVCIRVAILLVPVILSNSYPMRQAR